MQKSVVLLCESLSTSLDDIFGPKKKTGKAFCHAVVCQTTSFVALINYPPPLLQPQVPPLAGQMDKVCLPLVVLLGQCT